MPRNREAEFLRLIRGENAGLPARAARLGLGAAAAGYGLGVRLRNMAYDRGWMSAHRVSIPVLSIGNLTLGGTGKTPMVEWVARWYRRRGVRVVILSRGYRRDGAGGVNDEALVLEENLPDVPHLQDPDRRTSARVAVEELESELIVLDDGFQHRGLARDLDFVLLDALDPFGTGRLFPRGLLRESPGSLRRADLVVLTRADQVSGSSRDAIRAEAERQAGAVRWVSTRHAPVELIGEGVQAEPVGSLKGRSIAAFCGIGNPEGFRRTIEPLGGAVVGFRTYPDHHGYQASDVADLTAWARALGADLVLTTQKDLVKLRVQTLGHVPLRALRIGLEIMEGGALLEDALGSLLPGLLASG
ncbi:MAG: tetraacyldisaccharide 4'-kinase [Isosphaeraceae bacterium]